LSNNSFSEKQKSHPAARSASGGAGKAASHPTVLSAQSRRAKIPFFQPPSFLPVCWKPPAIFSGGGTSNWVMGEVRYLY